VRSSGSAATAVIICCVNVATATVAVTAAPMNKASISASESLSLLPFDMSEEKCCLSNAGKNARDFSLELGKKELRQIFGSKNCCLGDTKQNFSGFLL
jgi:hypothetical protein